MEQAKKKILVIARWPVGGIRTYFRYIYSQDIFKEYEFTFVMPDIDGAANLLQENLKVSGFNLALSPSSGIDLLRLASKILREEKYDLIHSHGFTAGVMSLPLQLRFRIPHLLTTHDVFSDKMFDGFMGLVKKNIMRWVLGSCTKLMPVGADAEKNLHKYFPTLKNKTQAIRNGIPTRYFFEGQKRDLKRELKLADNAFLVGFFGRFMAQKGFRFLAAAINKLRSDYKEHQLRVVCFGWGGFIREEQEQLRLLGIEQYFSFMPQTNDMPAAIKGVDIVAMPSLWEACPLLPMEVLSAGVPIVGTSCIGSKEVFENTPAYVVEPESVDALANVIKLELETPSRAKFEAFAPTAVERFSSEVSAEKLEMLYRELI